MPFCPRCGASTTPQMAFCTSCGEGLASVSYPQSAPPISPAISPAPAQAYGAGPSMQPRGPVGQHQDAALVVILTLVTFGIYGFFYWWRISKEIDAYMIRPALSHKPIRIAVITGAAVFVLGLVAFIAFFSALGSAASSGSDAAFFPMLAGMMMFFPLVMIGAIATFILWLVGEYRVWRLIEEEERSRNHPNPLSPGLQLLFVLIPYVNFVTSFIALYKTQERLNEAWASREEARRA